MTFRKQNQTKFPQDVYETKASIAAVKVRERNNVHVRQGAYLTWEHDVFGNILCISHRSDLL
jgi:hypothetical protein